MKTRRKIKVSQSDLKNLLLLCPECGKTLSKKKGGVYICNTENCDVIYVRFKYEYRIIRQTKAGRPSFMPK